MLKTLIRPAMIFVPFLLGILFPQAHVLNDGPVYFIRWALIAMVFLSCLQIRLSELRPQREHWVILGLNLLMGIVPYGILRAVLPDALEYALAAFFVGITPTATAAPVVVAFLNGRIGFALTGFTITNVFISLAMLGLLPAVTGNFSIGFAAGVAKTLLLVVALPFGAALLARRVWPAIRELPKRCRFFTFSLWSFNLFIMAAVARQYFSDNPQVGARRIACVALISLALCIGNFHFGRLCSGHRYCRESSQLLGQKNTTFTMYLALQYAGAFVAMGPIFYILWHNCWNAFQMYSYDRRKLRRQRRRKANSGNRA